MGDEKREHSSVDAVAFEHAARGWPIFPLYPLKRGQGETLICSCSGDVNCAAAGKHPRIRDYAREASCDTGKIRSWWTRWPGSGVGMPTGQPSGIDVIDIDGEQGMATIADLQVHHGILPATIAVRTPRGLHVYFKHTGRLRTGTGVLPGIDVRADGGLVILPGSMHRSGKTYEWEADFSPDDVELVDPPEWLIDELGTERERKRTDPLPEVIPSGSRNATLASLAGSMRHRNASESAILAALLAENQRCDPPLPESEVRAIAASMARYDGGSAVLIAPRNGGVSAAPIDQIGARPFTAAELLTGPIPEIDWLVEHLFPQQTICLLGGDAGVGKSWLAYSLAIAVAGGTRYLREFSTARSNVLVFDAESGENLLRRRLRKLCNGLQIDGTDLPLTIYTAALRLDSTKLVDWLCKQIEDTNAKLIIVDPLIHSLPLNASENDAAAMARMFELVRLVISRTGSTFLFLHHARKTSAMAPNTPNQMLRGSTAIRGILDSYLFARKLRDRILVEHDKSRHAEPVEPFLVDLHDVDFEATRCDYAGPADESHGGLIVAAIAFIERLLADAGGCLRRREIIEAAAANDIKQRTVVRALTDGITSGDLQKYQRGRETVYAIAAQEILENE